MFKLGDVVCLKSGGRSMTVEEVNDGLIKCVFNDDEGVTVRANYYSHTLKLCDCSKSKCANDTCCQSQTKN